MEHVEQVTFMPSTLRIFLHPNEHSMFVDIAALDALEIVNNSRTAVGIPTEAANASLLTVVDRTNTRAGKRLLRRELLEPCAIIGTIRKRQDVVEELMKSENLYYAVVTVLKTFPDLERSIASLMTRENSRLRMATAHVRGTEDAMETMGGDNEERGSEDIAQDVESEIFFRPDVSSQHPPSMTLIQNVLNIKAALQTVPPILKALQSVSSTLLKAIAESLRNGQLAALEEKIGNVIEQEALPKKHLEQMRKEGAFAVKRGQNGMLMEDRHLTKTNRNPILLRFLFIPNLCTNYTLPFFRLPLSLLFCFFALDMGRST